MGLAYAQLAEGGNQKDAEKALRLLLKAERSGVTDVELHTKLGFIEQMSGDFRRLPVRDALTRGPRRGTALLRSGSSTSRRGSHTRG